MVNFDYLSGAIQSLFGLIPLIDTYFSEWKLNISWTTESIAQFKTNVRTIFSSELCPLIENEFSLPVLDAKIIASSLTIKNCMELLVSNINGLDKYTIESYLASKFTISDLANAKQRDPNHPVFSSRSFFNKLARVILNRKIQTILFGSNLATGPYLNENR
jgi:hypothetical protein